MKKTTKLISIKLRCDNEAMCGLQYNHWTIHGTIATQHQGDKIYCKFCGHDLTSKVHAFHLPTKDLEYNS